MRMYWSAAEQARASATWLRAALRRDVEMLASVPLMLQ